MRLSTISKTNNIIYIFNTICPILTLDSGVYTHPFIFSLSSRRLQRGGRVHTERMDLIK